jgi:hypothetical protein
MEVPMSGKRVAGVWLVAGLSLLVVSACGGASSSGGGGSAEATAAAGSKYTCEREQVFEAAVKSVEKMFTTVKQKDLEQGIVIGEPRWYDRDGSPRPVGVALADLKEGDLALAVRIRVIDMEPNFRFEIDSVVKLRQAGAALARDLPEGDPGRPAWIQARLDTLRLDIHGQLEQCASLVREPR